MKKTIFIDVDTDMYQKVKIDEAKMETSSLPAECLKIISQLHLEGVRVLPKNDQKPQIKSKKEWSIEPSSIFKIITENINRNQLVIPHKSKNSFQEFTNLVKINGQPVCCGILELTLNIFHVINMKVLMTGKKIKKTFIQLPELLFTYPIFKILRIIEEVLNLEPNIICAIPIVDEKSYFRVSAGE